MIKAFNYKELPYIKKGAIEKVINEQLSKKIPKTKKSLLLTYEHVYL